MNDMTRIEPGNALPALAMSETELVSVLGNSLYPGAKVESIKLAIGYCKASGLDPMQKPVHIVPMWDAKAGISRDTIMPGIGLYRVQAARSGAFAGVTEPEYGPDMTENLGGVSVTFPAWCRVTVKRLIAGNHTAEFTAVERWKENYAIKGGKEKSIAPNAMWMKRPYGQLAKCAEAQALRKAFPEIGSQPTADEMEGRVLNGDVIEGEIIDASRTFKEPQSKKANTPQAAEGSAAPKAAPEKEAGAAPTPAATEDKPKGAAVAATPGALKTISLKADAAGIPLAEVLTHFSLAALEGIDMNKVNEILAWLRKQGE